MQAFCEFKAIWDPAGKMNPGKLIDAYKVDQHLRLGPDYQPVALATKMAFRTKVGDGFVRATEHCIGMGKCRAMKGGTMCPSYRGTREERYSTRGRARLLNEMLRGDLITDRWQSQAANDVIDAGLGREGRRRDCPDAPHPATYPAAVN